MYYWKKERKTPTNVRSKVLENLTGLKKGDIGMVLEGGDYTSMRSKSTHAVNPVLLAGKK